MHKFCACSYFTKYGFEPPCKQSFYTTAVSEEFTFQQRVRRLRKVGRVNSLHRDSRMRGRILCFSSNRVEKFIADTGTSVTFILKMVAERNRVKWFPINDHEPYYEGVTGMKLTVIG